MDSAACVCLLLHALLVLLVLAQLVHVALVLARPRHVVAGGAALVERDEKVGAEVAVVERELGGAHLLLGGFHVAAHAAASGRSGSGEEGSQTEPERGALGRGGSLRTRWRAFRFII